MKVEAVLSEIIGVPCGNVKFTTENYSEECFDHRGYIHGMTRCYIEFTTQKPLLGHRFGSLFVLSYRNNVYYAALIQGKETARIAQAVADGLKFE